MSKLRCYTCLELDRRLSPLQDQVKYLFMLLCPKMFSDAKHAPNYLICWECEYMAHKIYRFQIRLQKANNTLKLSVKDKTTVIVGLSGLKQSAVETFTVPETISTIPEILPNELFVTKNALKISTEENLAELLPMDPQIKVEREEDESCCNDFDLLIKPTTIHQLPIVYEPPLSLAQKKPKIAKQSIEIEIPPPIPVIKETVTPVTCHIPPKVFTNPPKQQVALRGIKETVKVTVDEPIFTDKESPVLVHSDNEPQKRKHEQLIQLIAPTSKREKLVIRPLVGSAKDAEDGSESRVESNYKEDEAILILLNRTEMNEVRTERRNNPLFLRSVYKCRTCIEWFQTQENFDEHNLKHDESRGNSVCEICEQRFPDDFLRDVHYKQHFIIYKCVQCPHRHIERFKISDHYRKNHEKSTFQCSKCDEVFTTFKERRSHITQVHDCKRPCKECGKIFASTPVLRQHILNMHKLENVKCLECGLMLKQSSMKSHMKSHEGQKRKKSAKKTKTKAVKKSQKKKTLTVANE